MFCIPLVRKSENLGARGVTATESRDFSAFFMNQPLLGHELLHFVISKFMKIAEIFETLGLRAPATFVGIVNKDNFIIRA
jgi:hypothetical protein